MSVAIQADQRTFMLYQSGTYNTSTHYLYVLYHRHNIAIITLVTIISFYLSLSLSLS